MINPNWSLQSACPLFENVTVSWCIGTLMNYSSSISLPKGQPPHISRQLHINTPKVNRYALAHINNWEREQIRALTSIWNPHFLQECVHFHVNGKVHMRAHTQIWMLRISPCLHTSRLNGAEVKYYSEESVICINDDSERCSGHTVCC